MHLSPESSPPLILEPGRVRTH